ncbi:MAG: hypothetical protein QOF14_5255 [Hyphomicrobiales bacterium]|jgi:hypothetical protein|nr:hypothetical protein [Hyphomicrobiales bacterium]
MSSAKLAVALIASLLIIAMLAGRSHAQIATPEPIESSLPERWHAPLAQFLRDFGARDLAAIVAGAKGSPLHHLPDTVIIRLEHSSACFKEICLTIVGESKGQKLHPLAMFMAGKWVTRGDVFPQFLGTSVYPPLSFYTSREPLPDTGGVALVETRLGWIVSTTQQ